MIHHKHEQGTAEWAKARIGMPTASEFHKIITPGGKISSQAEGYMHRIIAEIILGVPIETPSTGWMTRGNDLEDAAIAAYEFATMRETDQCGFLTTDDGRIGASPDRLAGDEGLVEIKCPAPHTHIGYMLSREIDKEKFPQVQGQLLVSERKWVDIVSYHPHFPLVVTRVARDEAFIGNLRILLDTFNAGIDTRIGWLRDKYGKELFERKEEERITSGSGSNGGDFDLTDQDVAQILAAGRALTNAYVTDENLRQKAQALGILTDNANQENI